jgi:hypothetical protein
MKAFHNYKDLAKKLLSLLFYGLKAAIFGFFLVVAPIHWSLALIFLLFAFYFYFQPLVNREKFFYSFLVLIVVSFLAVYLPLIPSQWLWLAGLFYGFLFFLLLGAKNLIFANRQLVYNIFNVLLLLVMLTFFFMTNNSQGFFIKYLVMFLGIIFLARDFLNFSLINHSGPQKNNLMAWSLAFLTLQLLWVIALLPIGFINAAILALLVTLILEDFIVRHLKGTISRLIVLRNATILLILSLIIFGLSKWQL